MDVSPEAAGMTVGKLKLGVVTGSPGAGEESEEGVDAWSVPSKSGVGVVGGLKSPHPTMKRSATSNHKKFLFFMIFL